MRFKSKKEFLKTIEARFKEKISPALQKAQREQERLQRTEREVIQQLIEVGNTFMGQYKFREVFAVYNKVKERLVEESGVQKDNIDLIKLNTLRENAISHMGDYSKALLIYLEQLL